jgi:hypothetical protein
MSQEAEEVIQNLTKDLYKEMVLKPLANVSYKKVYQIVKNIQGEIENNGLLLGK